jgi:hypothetical protein
MNTRTTVTGVGNAPQYDRAGVPLDHDFEDTYPTVDTASGESCIGDVGLDALVTDAEKRRRALACRIFWPAYVGGVIWLAYLGLKALFA